jgi:hypothetical protein
MYPDVVRFPFSYGHAVTFPRALATDLNLPLEANRNLLFDSSDLPKLGERIIETMEFWAQNARYAPGLDAKRYKVFKRRIICPELDLAESIGARIRGEQAQFMRLSDEQKAVVEGFIENERLLIRGGAGTGKTVLALEAARHLADLGQRVLLICFTKQLATHLREATKEWELPEGKVHTTHFHALAASARTDLGHNLNPPEGKEAISKFWEEEVPMSLFEAIDEGIVETWDSIIVDEGQDFSKLWWDILEHVMTDEKSGHLLVFEDPSQDIFGRTGSGPDGLIPFNLTRNFRNTRSITSVVSRFCQIKMVAHSRAPLGTPPSVHPMADAKQTRKEVGDLIKKLTTSEKIPPQDIVILTPRTQKNSSFAEMQFIGGVRLSDDPQDRSEAILHSSIGAFKGLESTALIFADVDPDYHLCTPNYRYVAASRARHLLHVFTYGDWMAGAAETDVA